MKWIITIIAAVIGLALWGEFVPVWLILLLAVAAGDLAVRGIDYCAASRLAEFSVRFREKIFKESRARPTCNGVHLHAVADGIMRDAIAWRPEKEEDYKREIEYFVELAANIDKVEARKAMLVEQLKLDEDMDLRDFFKLLREQEMDRRIVATATKGMNFPFADLKDVFTADAHLAMCFIVSWDGADEDQMALFNVLYHQSWTAAGAEVYAKTVIENPRHRYPHPMRELPLSIIAARHNPEVIPQIIQMLERVAYSFEGVSTDHLGLDFYLSYCENLRKFAAQAVAD